MRPDSEVAAPEGTATHQPAEADTDNSRPLSIPELPPSVDTLTAALAYAECGGYVLPVRRTDSKNPGSVVGKHWQDKSSRDPQQIIAWFAGTDHGIALHCGRSGAVVFDVDKPDEVPAKWSAHLDGAPCQSSRPDTPGRCHYVFAMPPGRSIGCPERAWGEVRGLNGVIIVEPSHHKEGGEYRWLRTGPVPVLLPEIADDFADASPAEDSASDAQIKAFLTEHTASAEPGKLHGWTKALSNHFANGHSRHASTVSVSAGAMKEARLGLYPAQVAVDVIREMFLTAVAKPPASTEQDDPRVGDVAESEWHGILAWAVGQALAADLDEVRARVDEKMHDNWAWMDSAGQTEQPPPVDPISLADARSVFARWFGKDYDTDALDAMLAAAAVERFNDGSDLVWLLLISGPGMAKTETAQALEGIGAVVTSSISSEAALLSATPKKDRNKGATGGLLRRLGDRGVLVLKDVTTILSMDRNTRGQVLAALREIYDGRWYREVGTDGGRTLGWEGRIAVIGAVTTAWDSAHGVVSAMGDRFVLLRIDSTKARPAAGRKAIGNTGSEPQMRRELSGAVAGVVAGMNTEPTTLTDAETERLLAAADLVTLARTGVEYDYRGDVIDAHAPEAPTRFAKQLAQIVRGGVAIGMGREEAMRLAIRCARDSMPPLRLTIIDDLAEHASSSTQDVRRRVNKPRTTVDRQLQALHMLGIADVEEVDLTQDKVRWYYSLAADIDPKALKP